MHWLRFCWAEPQVVPLTVAGVKLVGVKVELEAAVESLGWALVLVEDAAVLLVPVAAVVLVLCAKIAGRATRVAIKVGLNMLTAWFETRKRGSESGRGAG